MGDTLPQITSLFRDEFELCAVSPDESIVLATQAESRESYVDAAQHALASLGASSEVLTLPGLASSVFDYGGRPGHMLELDRYVESRPNVVETLRDADLVVDLTADRLVHTNLRWQTIDGGARMVSIHEPPEILERLAPQEGLAARIERGEDLLESADRMSVTSEAGTDLTVDLTGETLIGSVKGYAAEPGTWDNFPGGFIACYTTDDSYEGRIVMDAGDVILPMGRYVDDPVEFTISEGRVTEVSGSGADAYLIEDYYERWDTPEAYAMSHVGFGLNERAEWTALAFNDEATGNDARSYVGNFMWSTGPNQPVMDRDVRSHLDFPMRGCTIALDGTVVIEAGDVVHEGLQP